MESQHENHKGVRRTQTCIQNKRAFPSVPWARQCLPWQDFWVPQRHRPLRHSPAGAQRSPPQGAPCGVRVPYSPLLLHSLHHLQRRTARGGTGTQRDATPRRGAAAAPQGELSASTPVSAHTADSHGGPRNGHQPLRQMQRLISHANFHPAVPR